MLAANAPRNLATLKGLAPGISTLQIQTTAPNNFLPQVPECAFPLSSCNLRRLLALQCWSGRKLRFELDVSTPELP